MSEKSIITSEEDLWDVKPYAIINEGWGDIRPMIIEGYRD